MRSQPSATSRYDLLVVGTGFASSFFLSRWLDHADAGSRALVLERGQNPPHAWYVEHRADIETRAASTYENRTPNKRWVFSVGFGGGSNCWWACTPRMVPEDFELQSRYGVGADWPVSYDELEEYYCDAEELMSISGDNRSPVPRSRPYPLPPHRLADTDEVLRRAYPDLLFPQPTARASRTVDGQRPQCCVSGSCHACPIDAKFRIANGMMAPYRDERVALRTGARVLAVEVQGASATGVRYESDGREEVVRADLVVVGANALFNPEILLRSGIDDGLIGVGVVEQGSINFAVDVAGVDAFGGSTSITGHGYMLYEGEHRRERPAALLEFYNVPRLGLRRERGRWRQRVEVKAIYEELRQDKSRVEVARDGTRPAVSYAGSSDYLQRGLDRAEDDVLGVLAPFEVEAVHRLGVSATEAHVLGSVVMGDDPATSVVDDAMVHHRIRNLVVAGGSAFPTAAPANPSLTIAALSLRSAEKLVGRG